ncbi:putative nuclease HARBI1 [Diabrotica virgifera virgifera]|uniref:Putative nuclease HARBI1 n=1 Tax=Diabrotica virgifera virgifera TaxID=50390 RepID=A0ABM5L2E9_DIAVI|nr:putative nuclease HARBI1 [Diabrotica virgifera virgifera]
MDFTSDDEEFLEVVEELLEPNRQRVYRTRENQFEKWDDTEFRNRYRMGKACVEQIVDMISEDISSNTNRNEALTSSEMVLVALRFLATGCFLKVSGDLHGVSESSVCRAVHKVCHAIAIRANNFIKMPRTQEQMSTVKNGFYSIAKFPKCVGAVDCTHVRIQSPGGDTAELYRNRKNFFSFNIQLICDSELNIQNIVCRWPGSAHDSHIFRSSRIKEEFENGDFGNSVIVGDSGYGIKPYLITPLANPRTPAENLFNESPIRTRNPIERCIGVWKRRFPVLAYGLRVKSTKVEAIVVTCAVLHNIAMANNDNMPDEIPFFQQYVAETFVENEINMFNHNRDNTVRLSLINYFDSLIEN